MGVWAGGDETCSCSLRFEISIFLTELLVLVACRGGNLIFNAEYQPFLCLSSSYDAESELCLGLLNKRMLNTVCIKCIGASVVK